MTQVNSPRSDKDGRRKVHPTSKPWGTHTFWTGLDDAGTDLLWSLAAADAFDEVILGPFEEDVYVKRGEIYPLSPGAPFGSKFSAEVLASDDSVVLTFVRKIPVQETLPAVIAPQDRSYLPKGLRLRFTLFNSDPAADSRHDAATAWKASGWVELFRATTVPPWK